MTDFVYHELKCKGIKEKLTNIGVVYSKRLTSKSCPEGEVCPYVLDYSKCNAKEWLKEKLEIIKSGMIDCSIKGPDGRYGVRKECPIEIQEQLGFFPVEFSEDGNVMTWFCRYISNPDVAFYASYAIPEDVMIYTEFYENELDRHYCIQNGNRIQKTEKL